MDTEVETTITESPDKRNKEVWQSYVDNFDRLCRLCLSRERLISIYCNVKGRNVYFIRNLVKFALDLLKIKINKHDALPNFVCEACEKQMAVIVQFKRKCDESMNVLHRVLEQKLIQNRTDPIQKADVPQRRRRKRTTTKRPKQDYKEILKKLPQGIRVEKRSANAAQTDMKNDVKCPLKVQQSSNNTVCVPAEDQDKQEMQKSEQENHIQSSYTQEHHFEETLNIDVKCCTLEEEIEYIYTDDNIEDSTETHNHPIEAATLLEKANPIGIRKSIKEPKKPLGKAKVQCSVCEVSVINIRSHMAIHSVRSHNCDQCPKSFISRHKLQSHINGVHLRKRDFKCEICGKAFLEKNNLKGHMRIHNGERKYACDRCPKRFLFAGTLRSHLLTHTQEKHHKCEICGKPFLLRTTLNKHMRVHSGEKPHCCSVCDKRFRTTTHLVVHMRTHTGEKPLACRICGMAFAHHKGRSVHMKAKHPQELVALGLIDDRGHLKCIDSVELLPSSTKC